MNLKIKKKEYTQTIKKISLKMN